MSGPMQEESVGGSRYFVTFIDIHSRYCQLFFLKNKSEVCDRFKQYVEQVKTSFGKKPKVLRCDRGGEYTGNALQDYLKQEGIKFECTVGYASEQNGIAERKNRSLMEAARTMLFDAGMPKCWWVEAVNTANYVSNRMVSRSTNSIPYEIFFNKMPDFVNFHVFGTHVYSLVPSVNRRKLDEKAKKMRHLGCDESSKGYRLADMTKRKVVVSRNVNFLDENRSTEPVEMVDVQQKVSYDDHIDLGMMEEVDDSGEELDDELVEEPEDLEDESVGESEDLEDESVGEQEELEEEIQVNTPRRSTRKNLCVKPVKLEDMFYWQK